MKAFPSLRTKGAGAFKVASAPPALRIYAVGDIHGRLDLLDRLAQKLRDDLRDFPCAQAVTVFLGDYIDRGPGVAGVIERLASGEFVTPIVTLRGNHEALLLAFLDDESLFRKWCSTGGLATLASYGLDMDEPALADSGGAQQALRSALPRAHLDFLLQTKFSWSCGDYFFCHAGVRPGVPLARQSEHDLMWIRHEFLGSAAVHEKIVVHGHTPVESPENLDNRINVDTGAYATGVLSCVVLEGCERRFLSS